MKYRGLWRRRDRGFTRYAGKSVAGPTGQSIKSSSWRPLGVVALPTAASILGWSRHLKLTTVVCVLLTVWSAINAYSARQGLHFIGFIFIGGGLAVFVSEWRGYSAKRPVIFAEAAYYTAILYDFVVVPGSLMILATGPLLIWKLGLSYFNTPWLTGKRFRVIAVPFKLPAR